MLKRSAHKEFLDRYLQFLAVEGPGYFRNSKHLIRHMMGSEITANPVPNFSLKRVIQFSTLPEYNEKGHIIFTTRTLYTYNQAIENLWNIFHDTIDFATAHANTLAVNRRVGSAINDGAALGSDLHPIAMPPHTGIHFKVALAITFVLWIVPEEQGHRRHRLRDYQFAHFINKRLAIIVERFHLGSQ